jgi:formate--tetrahydrofolate ligase
VRDLEQGRSHRPRAGSLAALARGSGAIDLADVVAEAAVAAELKFLYPAHAPLRDKITAKATLVYGADGVDYSAIAAAQLDVYERNGFGDLPVCIAKTRLSLSWKGGP